MNFYVKHESTYIYPENSSSFVETVPVRMADVLRASDAELLRKHLRVHLQPSPTTSSANKLKKQ